MTEKHMDIIGNISDKGYLLIKIMINDIKLSIKYYKLNIFYLLIKTLLIISIVPFMIFFMIIVFITLSLELFAKKIMSGYYLPDWISGILILTVGIIIAVLSIPYSVIIGLSLIVFKLLRYVINIFNFEEFNSERTSITEHSVHFKHYGRVKF